MEQQTQKKLRELQLLYIENCNRKENDMKDIDFEDEIAVLESALSYLEMAMQDILDSPYHSHLKDTWEMDADEIQARLDELYMLQDDIYRNEMFQQNKEYEEGRL